MEPRTPSPARVLLVAVINEPEKVEEILAGFVDLGITGATIIPSQGMGRVLSRELPAFAGLQSLLARFRPENRTILSVVAQEQVEAAIGVIQEACGDLGDPATGIVFTLPVERVVGLAPALPREGGEAGVEEGPGVEEG